MQANYAAQKEKDGYKSFLNSGVVVDGVYDDHDFGGNDCRWRVGLSRVMSIHPCC
jgi:hypothetical protein